MSGCHAPTLVDEEFHDVSPIMKMIQTFSAQLDELKTKCETEWKMFYSSAEGLSKRMAKLEEAYKADFVVAKDIIFAGAQTHASILKLEAEIKELKRFQDITHKQHENVVRKKQPHKCPICEGTTFCSEGMMCVPCDGTGIVWG